MLGKNNYQMNSLKKLKTNHEHDRITRSEGKEGKNNYNLYYKKTICYIDLELTKKNIQAKPRYACKIKCRYKHKIQ